MTSIAAPASTAARPFFSARAMTVFGVIAAATFSASSGAPTPLYRVYQEAFGLSPLMLTVIFGSYAFALLAALLTVGKLSDYVGRRPMILASLALNAVAMFIFIEAQSAATLIVARVVQGFATGMATTTLGAAILDTNRTHGPLFNSITVFVGLTLGALGAAALVTYAPHPTQFVYIVLLAVSLVEAALLAWMPETAVGKPGALASLRPHVSVPDQARQPLLRVSPVNIAGWALGGFYLSLMPSLVRAATDLTSPFVGGIVVSALMFTAAVAVVTLRNRPAAGILVMGTAFLVVGVAITLAGVHTHLVPVMLAGTMVAGAGMGSVFSGTFRLVLPLAAANERAGLLAAFYVESYLAFSLPAILAGLLAPRLGLTLSADIYGGAVIVLALISLIAVRAARGKHPIPVLSI
jgi:hypothetical protein